MGLTKCYRNAFESEKKDKNVKDLPSPPWNRLWCIEAGEAKIENIEEWTEERIDWSME